MDVNSSIGCRVTECQYHAGDSQHCTLDKIMVGKIESYSSKSEDTDCESFKPKEETAF
ncbi:protein of unknown function [Anaerocolumna jejuensis DSM 15929]|uniref:DUF1540 domain-containing protein n=1 Tax=Anaerocolumna jejuensis DSM 15929 TaxID=1121322 RepID=A0A1M6WGL2_9FIRM|nr:DUF1540 domain-containing protein [Anaerocolumna jejuensis]SHK92736.1 protein of unknown function [Anaerocolumna jejuensis DSM 15929]